MTRCEFNKYVAEHYGIEGDHPWLDDDDTAVYRHQNTKKWFAILMEHCGETIMNVKCDPFEGELLREAYDAITPAYHMNKTHWITLHIAALSEGLIKELIRKSFALTDRKKKK
jgi:predicted DNA-binding protein (MmcQ/YjbR family)